MGHRWTKAQAVAASRKGLSVRRQRMGERPADWTRGYRAGWVACERFYRRTARREAGVKL